MGRADSPPPPPPSHPPRSPSYSWETEWEAKERGRVFCKALMDWGKGGRERQGGGLDLREAAGSIEEEEDRKKKPVGIII